MQPQRLVSSRCSNRNVGLSFDPQNRVPTFISKESKFSAEIVNLFGIRRPSMIVEFRFTTFKVLLTCRLVLWNFEVLVWALNFVMTIVLNYVFIFIFVGHVD